jgi:hypothetical protein
MGSIAIEPLEPDCKLPTFLSSINPLPCRTGIAMAAALTCRDALRTRIQRPSAARAAPAPRWLHESQQHGCDADIHQSGRRGRANRKLVLIR